MNCPEARKRVTEFVDGELKTADRLDMLKHLGSCPKCAQATEDARIFALILRERLQPGVAPEEVRLRLKEHLRLRQEESALIGPASSFLS